VVEMGLELALDGDEIRHSRKVKKRIGHQIIGLRGSRVKEGQVVPAFFL
jgi:uncharacterized protein (UPF0264 family)